MATTSASVLKNNDKFEMGRKFLRLFGSRLGFLSIGSYVACLYNDGTMPLFSDLVNMSHSGSAISGAISCKVCRNRIK